MGKNSYLLPESGMKNKLLFRMLCIVTLMLVSF
jgi:hypothetical protein